MSGDEKGIYEPFATPLDGERHIFVVLAKKAAKAGVGEGENDESDERGEGIIPVRGKEKGEKSERHPAVPGALHFAQLLLRYIYNPSAVSLSLSSRPTSSHSQCPSLSHPLPDRPSSPLLLETHPARPRLVPLPISWLPEAAIQLQYPPAFRQKWQLYASFFSLSFSSNNVLKMAKRVPQSPDVEDATAAFKRFSLGAPTTQFRTQSSGPSFRSGSLLTPGMAARRNKPLFKLSDITGEQQSGGGAAGAGPAVGVPDVSERPPRRPAGVTSTPFANFGKIVYVFWSSSCSFSSFLASDPSGVLNFDGKAILHSSGVNFSNGSSFLINMDQLQLGEELGSGAYGTVKRVIHKPTNVAMAMKVGPVLNFYNQSR